MQLLVRTVDKELSGDPVVDRMRSKRGYVIAAKPDGEKWGVMELTNPEWVIISVSNMTQEQADILTSPEVAPKLDTDYVPRKRHVILDLEAIKELEGVCVRTEKTDLTVKYADVKSASTVEAKVIAETELSQMVETATCDKEYTIKSVESCIVVIEADVKA
jgi:hypothetical protein